MEELESEKKRADDLYKEAQGKDLAKIKQAKDIYYASYHKATLNHPHDLDFQRKCLLNCVLTLIKLENYQEAIRIARPFNVIGFKDD